MFKRFDSSNDVSTSTQVKSSVQRGIKSQITTSHPSVTEEILDAFLPKKPPLVQYKIGPHLMLYCKQIEGSGNGDEPIFFQHRDGPILPTLKFVHKYPLVEFTKVTVDRGAIPYLLGGANVMCPGLTNVGGEMPADSDEGPGLAKGDGVVIYAEGKESALAVGFMKMSSADIRKKNKGTGIELCHFIGDGLWDTEEIN
ncbi:hypothetical protein THAOC_03538 [Thalassiosira oceanica]|uniref:PUA domain-containing protein n=1 Tax=Thalassiosira oceanica TaxID=159749 RepID=K0TCA7_THAOC|nr:hypothetical protein THAOC_03538 [Thalassiosira oceanica]|mmetsp:Transcript_4689/g.10466  ORF Transcript_4689/g.10466 Transcript_4689/m.10466 type:complete len:198 (+) Transcript_4689:201-794(+)|eukprot:EJK74769.1 hypothetical protein THAOC_03538 [Thalassiosira oceanica]